MNVFVSETCYRQVFGGPRGSAGRRAADFNRLVGRLQQIRHRSELMVKGLGTKKYHSLGHDVYGVDLNNGLTAERIIFVFLDAMAPEAQEQFGRYCQDTQPESVLLCYCSEHDAQDRHARNVGRHVISQGHTPDIALTLPDAQLSEFERIERMEVPWRTYGAGDLEQYGLPRTPVLTEDKFRIISDFLMHEQPMLVTGSAGSGKTELGLRILTDYLQAHPSERALYLTCSPRLLAEVRGRATPHARARTDFLTFEMLLRRLAGNADMTFAHYATFERFVAALRTRTAMGGTDRMRMLRCLDVYGPAAVYAEVYGVLGGSMGAAWDRLDVPESLAQTQGLLAESAYQGLSQNLCGITAETHRAGACALARAYASWIYRAQMHSANIEALRLLMQPHIRSYDLVIADEIQDLTEIQTELLYRLAGGSVASAPATDPAQSQNASGQEDATEASAQPDHVCLFMTGDVNQVLAPSVFDARRFLRMSPALTCAHLDGNFRNPSSVCAAANAVRELRRTSVRLPARRAFDAQAERSHNRAPGRTTWCLSQDEAALCQLIEEAANVVLVTSAPTARRLTAQGTNALTVEQVKGMEFDNVILYDLISGPSSRLPELFEDGPKDASLHRVVNELYVGMTRSCRNLLIVESASSKALQMLVVAAGTFERIADPSEAGFEFDATPRAYFEAGLRFKEQGSYAVARRYLNRALTLGSEASEGDLTADDEWYVRRLLKACTICEEHDPQATPAARMCHLFEEAGLPEEALPWARECLDDARTALLLLASEAGPDGERLQISQRFALFEEELLHSSLDLEDLYGTAQGAYDALIDWYMEERQDEIELYESETVGELGRTLDVLRDMRAHAHADLSEN